MAVSGSVVLRMRAETAEFNRSMQSARQTMNNFNQTLNIVKAAAASYLTVDAARAFIQSAAEAERLTLRMGAVMKATHNSIGMSLEDVTKFSSGLAKQTMFTSKEILDASAIIASYGGIAGKTFERVLELSADLAEVFGGGMTEAAATLTQALKNPQDGLESLGERGVKFTDAEKQMTQAMVEAGRAAEAHAIIMKRVEESLGGAAKAAGEGLGGALHRLGQELETLSKKATEKSGIAGFLTDVLNFWSSQMNQVGEAFDPRPIADVRSELARAEEAANGVNEAFKRGEETRGVLERRQRDVEALRIELAELEKQERKTSAARQQAVKDAAEAENISKRNKHEAASNQFRDLGFGMMMPEAGNLAKLQEEQKKLWATMDTTAPDWENRRDLLVEQFRRQEIKAAEEMARPNRDAALKMANVWAGMMPDGGRVEEQIRLQTAMAISALDKSAPNFAQQVANIYSEMGAQLQTGQIGQVKAVWEALNEAQKEAMAAEGREFDLSIQAANEWGQAQKNQLDKSSSWYAAWAADIDQAVGVKAAGVFKRAAEQADDFATALERRNANPAQSYLFDIKEAMKRRDEELKKLPKGMKDYEETVKRINQATETHIRLLREANPQGYWDAMAAGVRNYRDAMESDFQSLARSVESSMTHVEDAILDASTSADRSLNGMMNGVAKGFRNMAEQVLQDAARMMIRQSITGPLSTLMGSAASAMGNGIYNTLNWNNSMGGASTISGADWNSSLASSGWGGMGFDVQTFPGFASGGSVAGGEPIIVGERGPEIYVPRDNGEIVPNHALGGGGSAGDAITINVNVQALDARGVSDLLMSQKSLLVGIVQQAYNRRGKRGPLD